jgi:hypothetical protein
MTKRHIRFMLLKNKFANSYQFSLAHTFATNKKIGDFYVEVAFLQEQ